MRQKIVIALYVVSILLSLALITLMTLAGNLFFAGLFAIVGVMNGVILVRNIMEYKSGAR